MAFDAQKWCCYDGGLTQKDMFVLLMRTLTYQSAFIVHAGADRSLWGGIRAFDQGCRRCDDL